MSRHVVYVFIQTYIFEYIHIFSTMCLVGLSGCLVMMCVSSPHGVCLVMSRCVSRHVVCFVMLSMYLYRHTYLNIYIHLVPCVSSCCPGVSSCRGSRYVMLGVSSSFVLRHVTSCCVVCLVVSCCVSRHVCLVRLCVSSCHVACLVMLCVSSCCVACLVMSCCVSRHVCLVTLCVSSCHVVCLVMLSRCLVIVCVSSRRLACLVMSSCVSRDMCLVIVCVSSRHVVCVVMSSCVSQSVYSTITTLSVHSTLYSSESYILQGLCRMYERVHSLHSTVHSTALRVIHSAGTLQNV